jgi:hypothetical protein
MGDFNVENKSPVCDHLREVGYFSCFEVSQPQLSSLTSSSNDNAIGTRSSLNNPSQDEEVRYSTSRDSVTEYCVIPTSKNLQESDFSELNSSSASSNMPSSSAAETIGNEKQNQLTQNLSSPSSSSSLSSLSPSVQNTTSSTVSYSTVTKTTKYRSPHFVSHFNHRQEEVGVDHIFIKPEVMIPRRGSPIPFSNTKNQQIQMDEKNSSQSGSPNTSTRRKTIQKSDRNSDTSRNSSFQVPAFSTKSSNNSVSKNETDFMETSVGKDSIASSKISIDSSQTDQIFILKSEVLPTTLTFKKWDNTFQISDHRPVSATFIIGRPKVIDSKDN